MMRFELPIFFFRDGQVIQKTKKQYARLKWIEKYNLRQNCFHNITGPAIIWDNNNKTWFIDGKEYSEQEFNRIASEVIAMEPIVQLTDERWWVRELGKNNAQHL